MNRGGPTSGRESRPRGGGHGHGQSASSGVRAIANVILFNTILIKVQINLKGARYKQTGGDPVYEPASSQ
jgi:hypothetical protein